MNAVFLRLLATENKERALEAAVQSCGSALPRVRFDVAPSAFTLIPRSPFAYWVGEDIRKRFSDLPAFHHGGRTALSGGKTLDDFRWIRASWERRTTQEDRWRGYAKGGVYSCYYADIYLRLDWRGAGRSLKSYLVDYRERRGWSAHWTAELHGSEAYFRPGLTWSRRTQGGLSLRAMPRGCIFADKGPAAFVAGDDPAALMALLAVTNSRAFGALVQLQMAFGSYEVGVLQRTPVPGLSPSDESALGSLAHHAWSLKRALDTRAETSHVFRLPALLQVRAGSLAASAAACADRLHAVDAELAAVQVEIDKRCFELYGISDDDRKTITEAFGAAAAIPAIDEVAGETASGCAAGPVADARPSDVDPDYDADESESSTGDGPALTSELLSWCVGVAFGRFDLRLATGERALPPEPGPFDPLPVCSPGMLTGSDGLPCSRPPVGYRINIPQDGVLLDDPGHPRDLTASARAVFDAVFGSDADAHWQEAAGTLDPRNHDLRAFVARTFFEQHLKRYSKSRRKAPIYWQLATPSATYSVWLYVHRLTPDTFFSVLHDVVAPKLGLEERKLLSLTQESGPSPTASQRKEIASQETFVNDLRAFRDEVARVAPLWGPDLDDGVVLTMAPLWRLVPQHLSWQKELRAAWDSLCAGEYDWAYVAMHLWPERVVPKCATDRSLAIAHGLEEVFWEEDAKGNWTARKTPQTPVADLVVKRTSPAVKAALKALLEAPGASSSARSGGRGKRRAR